MTTACDLEVFRLLSPKSVPRNYGAATHFSSPGYFPRVYVHRYHRVEDDESHVKAEQQNY